MRRLAGLFRAISYKKLMLMIRYPVNSISRIITLYAFFMVTFLGGQALGSKAITDSMEGIIVGFFLFTMAVVANAGLSWAITEEAQWGTLEQFFMSPFGFATVMTVRSVVNVLFSFVWGVILLALMILTTGKSLHLDVLTVFPVAFLTVTSVAGIGFFFAGLALVYKRIQNVFALVKFGFIALIAAPVEQYELLKLAPMAVGSHLLRTAMQDGQRIWELPAVDLGLLVVTAIGYLLLGLAAFQLAQRNARRRGVMGDY